MKEQRFLGKVLLVGAAVLAAVVILVVHAILVINLVEVRVIFKSVLVAVGMETVPIKQ